MFQKLRREQELHELIHGSRKQTDEDDGVPLAGDDDDEEEMEATEGADDTSSEDNDDVTDPPPLMPPGPPPGAPPGMFNKHLKLTQYFFIYVVPVLQMVPYTVDLVIFARF